MRYARNIFVIPDVSELIGACYHGLHYYNPLIVVLGETTRQLATIATNLELTWHARTFFSN